MYEKSIFTQIIESPLPEERKQLLSSVFKGEQLADLCRDVIAKSFSRKSYAKNLITGIIKRYRFFREIT